MAPKVNLLSALVVGLSIGACAENSPERPELAAVGEAGQGGGSAAAGGVGGGSDQEPLRCLTDFIPARCAGSACHDSETRAYGMDLSTGASIYSAWVGRNGLDNCQGQLVARVVAGDPEASFVYRKVTSQLACVGSISQAMPPPPAPPLSPDQIGELRAWIAAGAPKYCEPGELLPSGGAPNEGAAGAAASGGTGVGGSGAAGGASAGTAGGDTAGGGGSGASSSDPFKCTASSACTGQLLCHAENCATQVWDCVTHRPLPAAVPSSSEYEPHHPCPTETMDYCGCDGVTFVASATCPDRPYQHPGTCGDGFNCNPYDVLCDQAAPTCPDDQAPAIEHECFADCVPKTSCRCEFNWECPADWRCDRTQWRCQAPPMTMSMSQGT